MLSVLRLILQAKRDLYSVIGMRKKHNNRILGRKPHHRLVSSLLKHGSIITTEAKAKELRRHVEPLITKAKGEMSLAKRRLLLSKLMHKEDFERLVDVAKDCERRPGGYLRLTRLPITRTDSVLEMRIEILSS